jgi:hypothetical protein
MGTASGFVKRASALNIKEKYEYSRQPESALGPSFSRLHCVVISRLAAIRTLAKGAA